MEILCSKIVPTLKQFTIILNLKCSETKIPEKLRSFYQYVNHGDAGDDVFTQRIKEMVERANESTEVQNMISVASDFAYIEKKLKAEIETLEAQKGTLEAQNEKLVSQKETLEAQLESQKQQLEKEKLEIARKMKEQAIPAEMIAAITGLERNALETL